MRFRITTNATMPPIISTPAMHPPMIAPRVPPSRPVLDEVSGTRAAAVEELEEIAVDDAVVGAAIVVVVVVVVIIVVVVAATVSPGTRRLHPAVVQFNA